MKFAIALFLAALPAHASTLLCRADYDEGSYYELSASTGPSGIEGDVGLRYVTDDGNDLRSALQPLSQTLAPGRKLELAARNEGMSVALTAPYDSGKQEYRGTLEVAFTLEHAEPLTLDATCSLR